ncbi:MAG: hypothetical protein ABT20_06565 [Rubrivivax sp. SCN 70-15]|nr:MAG: hypothetical protein ABT20_06565 [Rubrivivax sp. SCN 70-15]
MKMLRSITLALLAAGWLLGASAQGLRPEVGKPLQQASELLRAGKAREALAKVREAEAVPNRTPAETLTIERMKGAAAQRAGDNATAAQAFEAAMASGKLPAAEQGQVAESLAYAYSQLRNWPKTTEWANKAVQLGNNSPQLKQLIAYVQSQTGDYAAIAREAGAAVAAAEQAGRRPDEGDLLRLADAQQRTGNQAGYGATLEKLLFNYPKKDYWNAYLGRLPRKPGFAERLGLDVMRLRLATGTLSTTDDYMEMAQLTLQAGLPAEALRVLDQGFKSGQLGKGSEAARQQRLRELAVKQDAVAKASIAARATEAAAQKSGNDLVKVGYEYVTLGEVERGVELIRQGIAKDDLKYPNDARLRLGMALLQSPKTQAAATQTLRSVKGNDGVADIARLWLIAGHA